MNMRNIYLLVPVQGSGSMKGMDTSKIRMIVGRAKAEAAREAFERELNGGKLWLEVLHATPQGDGEAIDRAMKAAWVVHSDTWNSWNSYLGSEAWPVQSEVDAYVDSQS